MRERKRIRENESERYGTKEQGERSTSLEAPGCFLARLIAVVM